MIVVSEQFNSQILTFWNKLRPNGITLSASPQVLISSYSYNVDGLSEYGTYDSFYCWVAFIEIPFSLLDRQSFKTNLTNSTLTGTYPLGKIINGVHSLEQKKYQTYLQPFKRRQRCEVFFLHSVKAIVLQKSSKILKTYFGLVKQASMAGITDSKANVSCICKSLNYCRVSVNFKTRDCSAWGNDYRLC